MQFLVSPRPEGAYQREHQENEARNDGHQSQHGLTDGVVWRSSGCETPDCEDSEARQQAD